MPFAEAAGWVSGAEDRARVAAVVTAAGERIKLAGDILDFDYCFATADKVQYDEKAFQKRIAKAEGIIELMRQFAASLNKVEPFDAVNTESALKSFCEQRSMEMGHMQPGLRVAITGVAVASRYSIRWPSWSR